MIYRTSKELKRSSFVHVYICNVCRLEFYNFILLEENVLCSENEEQMLTHTFEPHL